MLAHQSSDLILNQSPDIIPLCLTIGFVTDIIPVTYYESADIIPLCLTTSLLT
jgi:hypothetical protein